MTYTGHRIDAAVAKAKRMSRTAPAVILHDARRGYAVVSQGRPTQSAVANGLRMISTAIDGRIAIVHS